MSLSAFIGFQGWNSWTLEKSMFSGMSRSASVSLLAGWFLASSLGGLISILVSRLELSSASRLRAAALSEAVLSEESCANERVARSGRKRIRKRVRTLALYRFRAKSKRPYKRRTGSLGPIAGIILPTLQTLSKKKIVEQRLASHIDRHRLHEFEG